MNIVLLGPPGSGKGTVSRFLQEKFGLRQVSTGDLLRQEILAKTPLGAQIAPILSSGKLVDNAIVARVLSNAISKAKKGFVLDGFPRNAEQVRILEKILHDTHQKIDLVLELVVPDEKIIERLSSRWQCSKCGRVYGLKARPKKTGVCDDDNAKLFQREDDKPQVIKDRLSIYRKETVPLLSYFRKTSKVVELDAGKEIAGVFKDVSKILSKHNGTKGRG